MIRVRSAGYHYGKLCTYKNALVEAGIACEVDPELMHIIVDSDIVKVLKVLCRLNTCLVDTGKEYEYEVRLYDDYIE